MRARAVLVTVERAVSSDLDLRRACRRRRGRTLTTLALLVRGQRHRAGNRRARPRRFPGRLRVRASARQLVDASSASHPAALQERDRAAGRQGRSNPIRCASTSRPRPVSNRGRTPTSRGGISVRPAAYTPCPGQEASSGTRFAVMMPSRSRAGPGPTFAPNRNGPPRNSAAFLRHPRRPARGLARRDVPPATSTSVNHARSKSSCSAAVAVPREPCRMRKFSPTDTVPAPRPSIRTRAEALRILSRSRGERDDPISSTPSSR